MILKIPPVWATPLLCVFVCLGTGCHSRHVTSGYGVAWVTLTAEPSDFASYIVKVDSITLTRSDGVVVTALASVETVDFAKLSNIAELWGSATIPNGKYLSAKITLDYTSAKIATIVNGAPQLATIVGATGAAVTTVPVVVTFDTNNPLVVLPTGATSNATRLAFDINLPASGKLNTATNPATLTVNPYFTGGILASDAKPIRVRGPLINSSVVEGTYTIYIRPFYDEVNSLGALTLFNDANTIYAVNGTTFVGKPGLTALSQSSAGTTITAAYTTFQPTTNTSLNPPISAGKFNTIYVVAGSTLEAGYTQGIEGDVIARSGNNLTLRGSTTSFNSGASTYNVLDSIVTVGTSTIVTVDAATVSGLNAGSIAVGQHIAARGLYSANTAGVVTVDASGATNVNTGSVRLLPTEIYGSEISTGAGVLALKLLTINNWPVGNYNFAGNGATAAQDSLATNYNVQVGSVPVPAGGAGTLLWVDGFMTPFGSAPPDFSATRITAEAAVAASLRVNWNGPAAASQQLTAVSAAGFSINLSLGTYNGGVIRIGPESIDLTKLPVSPQIVPSNDATTSIFAPTFALGSAAHGVTEYNGFASFVTQLNTTLITTPVQQLEARGTYNRVTNIFTASTVDIVL